MPVPLSRFAARIRTAVPGAVLAGALAGAVGGMGGVFLLEGVIGGWWSRCLSQPKLTPAVVVRSSAPPAASPSRPLAAR